MEKIILKGKLVGLKIKSLKAGSNPASDAHEPLQVMTLRHPKGAKVKPHAHKRVARTTMHLQECIVVLKGKVRVNLYGAGKVVGKRVTVKAGEAFVTLSGGHSIDFLEDTELIEVKNGPYKDDRLAII